MSVDVAQFYAERGLSVVAVLSVDPASVLATIETVLADGRTIVGVRKFGGWSADGFEPVGTAKPLMFEPEDPDNPRDAERAVGEVGPDGRAEVVIPAAEAWQQEPPPPRGFHLLTLPLSPEQRAEVDRDYDRFAHGTDEPAAPSAEG